MRTQKIISVVQERASFFNHLQERSAVVGHYRGLARLIFEPLEPKLNVNNITHKNERKEYISNSSQAYYTTQNIHEVSEVKHYLSVLNNKETHTNRENLYRQLMNNSVTKNQEHTHINQTFNQNILKKFLNFTSNVEEKSTYNKSTNNPLQSLKAKEQSHFYYSEIEAKKASKRVHPKETVSVSMEEIKALEERVLSRVEERIIVKKEHSSTHTLTKEERVVLQIEEKKTTEKLYRMVMKRWDKEQRRKGHLYD